MFKKIIYFFEFIIIQFFFIIFKLFGLKISNYIAKNIFKIIGPQFRSKKIINQNLKLAFPNKSENELNQITCNMWEYYGKIFSEYPFIKKFREENFDKNFKIIGKEVLDEIKKSNKPVIFISGHFDNFELMALSLEKYGINLSAIYRPLNNIYLNRIMENIRKKFICKNQIKKGIQNLKPLIRLFKDGYSVALMIDQRVSEGIKVNFFNKEAYTTTIPAQFVKKFNSQIVPIFIERTNENKFEMIVEKPFTFNDEDTIEKITLVLNQWLETKILKKPSQWIWSHNRWK